MEYSATFNRSGIKNWSAIIGIIGQYIVELSETQSEVTEREREREIGSIWDFYYANTVNKATPLCAYLGPQAEAGKVGCGSGLAVRGARVSTAASWWSVRPWFVAPWSWRRSRRWRVRVGKGPWTEVVDWRVVVNRRLVQKSLTSSLHRTAKGPSLYSQTLLVLHQA